MGIGGGSNGGGEPQGGGGSGPTVGIAVWFAPNDDAVPIVNGGNIGTDQGGGVGIWEVQTTAGFGVLTEWETDGPGTGFLYPPEAGIYLATVFADYAGGGTPPNLDIRSGEYGIIAAGEHGGSGVSLSVIWKAIAGDFFYCRSNGGGGQQHTVRLSIVKIGN